MSTANPSSSSSGGGGVGGGSGGSSGSSGGPCGACKFLRRKCVVGCIFAPYFDSEQGAAHFAAVHKVFGASNVSKLLLHIPVHKRPDAVVTICYEAQARLRDPVYGCVNHIFALQQQVVNLQAEISYIQSHLAGLELPLPPSLPQQPPLVAPQPPLSITDITPPSSITGASDLSSLLMDPIAQPSWMTMHQQRLMDPRQYGVSISSSTSGGDLQALAQELLRRHVPQPTRTTSMTLPDASPSPSSSK